MILPVGSVPCRLGMAKEKEEAHENLYFLLYCPDGVMFVSRLLEPHPGPCILTQCLPGGPSGGPGGHMSLIDETPATSNAPQPGMASEATPLPRGRMINREISWLAFNTRVIDESQNRSHPLLERLRFLSISASNLNEFYMVRVAGLKAQVRAGVHTLSDDGLPPERQLDAIHELAVSLIERQQREWQSLRGELAEAGIRVVGAGDLDENDREWLERYFMDYVFPILTPLAVDPAHPFPFIPNLGFSFALELTRPDGEHLKALVPIPSQIRRFVRLPGQDRKSVV